MHKSTGHSLPHIKPFNRKRKINFTVVKDSSCLGYCLAAPQREQALDLFQFVFLHGRSRDIYELICIKKQAKISMEIV